MTLNRKTKIQKKARRNRLITLPMLLLLISILLGLAASAYLYSGPDPFYDDAWYMQFAHEAANGEADFILDIFTYAFLNIVPIAASFKLFGYGSWQAILPSIIEYILLLLVTFQISKRIYGGMFAAAAVYMLALAPFLVAYTTRVLPDINMGFAVGLSVYAFIIARRKKTIAMSVLSGLLAAYTIYVKTQAFIYIALFIFVVIIAYLQDHKKKKGRFYEEKLLAATFIGLAVGLAAYFSVFYIVSGNPFSISDYMAIPSGETIAHELYTFTVPFSSMNAMLSYPTAMDTFPIGPLVLLAAIGTIIGLLKKNAEINYSSLLCWGMFFYTIFGTSSMHAYLRIPGLTRFFAIDATLFALLGGYALFFIYDFTKNRTKKKAALLKVAFAIVVIVIPLAYIPTYKVLKLNSINIVYSENMFNSSLGYLQKIVQNGGPINLHTLAPRGFRFNTDFYLNFIDGYNSSIHTMIIHQNGYDGITSLSCPLSAPGNRSFVLAVEPAYGPPGSDEENLLNTWLGTNCTIREIYSTPLYANYYSVIRIYVIENTSHA